MHLLPSHIFKASSKLNPLIKVLLYLMGQAQQHLYRIQELSLN
jgi:hypothetical protein